MQNRKLVLSLFLSLLLFSFCGMGQNNTSSPYSRFGIGELSSQGFGRNKAMGGTGIALRSNRILNNINPASYTAMDSMSFILEFGMKAGVSQFETNLQKQNESNVNFDYLSFAFPVTRWWASSMGVMPLSDVGYKINLSESNDNIGNISYLYEGSGGLNKAYWSNGIKLHRNFSVGFTMNYVFGSLDLEKTVGISKPVTLQKVIKQPKADNPQEYEYATIDDIVTAPVSGTNSLTKSQIRDFSFDFGMQFHKELNSNYELVVGATYSDGASFSTDFSNLTTVTRYSTRIQENLVGGLVNQELLKSTSKPDTISNIQEKRIIDLPKSYGIGFAVTKNKKLTLAMDYQRQNWSDTRFLARKDSLVNSDNFAFGMEYTPNPGAVRGYFNKVTYRLGGHYSNSYLKFRGEQLKDYGISLGAGFPLRRSGTYINVALEVGRRGTLSSDLIREDYAKFSINFSLFEHWFVKRKFD